MGSVCRKEKCILNYHEKSVLILTESLIGKSDQRIFNNDEVVLLEILGKGGFGTVQKGYHKVMGKYIALKFFKEASGVEEEEEQLKQIKFEDYLLKKVDELGENEFFLKYYGVLIDKSNESDDHNIKTSSLILEMESGITTLDDILRYGKQYNPDEILYVVKRLIKGFEVLQENSIAQRDVKAENIILVEDENEVGNFLYKISDFGIGCEVSKEKTLVSSQTLTGLSQKFAAPEVLKLWDKMIESPEFSESYDPFLADIYSLGIIFLKMVKYSLGKKELEEDVLKSDSLKNYGNLIRILKNMLDPSPKKRMNFRNLSKLITQMEVVDKISFNEVPKDERKFYEICRNEKEKRKGKTVKGLKNLYEEHKKLFEAYSDNIKRLVQAKYHLDRSWEIYGELKKTDGQVAPEEEIFLLNLYGVFFQKERELEKSGEYLQKALQMCENIFIDNKNQPLIGLTYYNKGILDWEKKELDSAEENCLKSLEIYSSATGNASAEAALCLNLLGIIYLKKEDFLKVEDYFKKCLEMRQKIFKVDNHHILQSYINLGLLNGKIKKYKESKEYYIKSLNICRALYGENNLVFENISNDFLEIENLLNSNDEVVDELVIKYESLPKKKVKKNNKNLISFDSCCFEMKEKNKGK